MSELLAMRAAYSAASASPDRSTQNGAVIGGDAGKIIATCNRFPRGIDPDDDDIHEKPLKYKIIVHAERNAIYQAARSGIRTNGRTMVACWAACPECAQAIVEAGIARIVVHADRMDATPDRWREDVDRGLWLLEKGGVDVVRLEGAVDAGVTIRFDGREVSV
jgi:dCMP deaminase